MGAISYEFNEISRCVKEYSHGRKIVIWGYGDYQDDLTEYLRESGIPVAFYVDDDMAQYNDSIMTASRYFSSCAESEHYLIVTALYSEKMHRRLTESGLLAEKDYVYPVHAPVTAEIDGDYADEYGNTVVFEGEPKLSQKLSITFKGYGAAISIGRLFSACGAVCVSCDSNSALSLGDNVSFGGDVLLTLYKTSVMHFGDDSEVLGGRISTMRSAHISVGDRSSIGRDCLILAHVYTSISIGCDCCISNDFHARTNDGHVIFDIETGKALNVSIAGNKTLKMVISDHVWIGTRAVVLGDSKIGKGSIIGACSLVKGIIPNNCIAVGIPAKVKRKNVAWCRRNYAEDIDLIPEQYVNYTDDSIL